VVGSRLAFVARFLGRRLAYTYEIVELVAWSSVDEGSTLMSLRNRGEPAGFAATTAPMMAAAMRRANRNDLARLKQLLEAAPEDDYN
jgi:hypothetical protein